MYLSYTRYDGSVDMVLKLYRDIGGLVTLSDNLYSNDKLLFETFFDEKFAL